MHAYFTCNLFNLFSKISIIHFIGNLSQSVSNLILQLSKKILILILTPIYTCSNNCHFLTLAIVNTCGLSYFVHLAMRFPFNRQMVLSFKTQGSIFYQILQELVLLPTFKIFILLYYVVLLCVRFLRTICLILLRCAKYY